MDDMLLLGSEYIFTFTLIGLVSALYVSCFLKMEELKLKRFIQDEIEKQVKNS
jgi:hypothetical protein